MAGLRGKRYMGRDHTTLANANRLRAVIEDYWRVRGYVITTWVEPFGDPQALSWAIRSNMVAGLPAHWNRRAA